MQRFANLLLEEVEQTVETEQTALHTFRRVAKYVDQGDILLVSLNLLGLYPGTVSTQQLERIDALEGNETDWYTRSIHENYPLTLLEELPRRTPRGAKALME